MFLNVQQIHRFEFLTKFVYRIVYTTNKCNLEENTPRKKAGELPITENKRLQKINKKAVNLQNLPAYLYVLRDSLPIRNYFTIFTLLT